MADQPDANEGLETDLVGWLTTVRPDGAPQASVVWFLVEPDGVLIYSSATASRLVNLDHNSRVAFNLRGDAQGRTVLTAEGTAVPAPDVPAAKDHPEYLAKYAEEITRLGWTPESFSSDYSVPLRVRFERVRTW